MILVGDCVEKLGEIPAGSVHCAVTSPPYWALRDYGVPPTKWPEIQFAPLSGIPAITVPAMECPLGLEQDICAFIAHIVHVFRQVRRVLREDGTIWVNMGDSYAQKPTGESHNQEGSGGGLTAWKMTGQQFQTFNPECPEKNLIGQPWRVAFALQADGWLLRNEIIIAKGMSFCPDYVGSVMPESARDRMTKSHEQIFLFAKNPDYYFDIDAVKEPASGAHSRGNGMNPKAKMNDSGSRQNESFSGSVNHVVAMRNPRTVWAIRNKPFKGEHFATYASQLVEKCILAGTSEKGVCKSCGAPIVRFKKEVGEIPGENYTGQGLKEYESVGVQNPSDTKRNVLKSLSKVFETEWRASCECEDSLFPAGIVPATVLDPFGGSGTTALAAKTLGRESILIELNPEYAGIALERLYEKGLRA